MRAVNYLWKSSQKLLCLNFHVFILTALFCCSGINQIFKTRHNSQSVPRNHMYWISMSPLHKIEMICKIIWSNWEKKIPQKVIWQTNVPKWCKSSWKPSLEMSIQHGLLPESTCGIGCLALAQIETVSPPSMRKHSLLNKEKINFILKTVEVQGCPVPSHTFYKFGQVCSVKHLGSCLTTVLEHISHAGLRLGLPTKSLRWLWKQSC